MTAVQKVEKAPQDQLAEVPAVPGETAAVLSMIERVARDPAIDVERLFRLIDMQERILSRNAKMEFTAAKAAMQPHLPIIDENGEIKNRAGEIQSTYALWEDINELIKPVLAEYGFDLSFRTENTIDLIKTTGILSHRGGHTEETTISLPIDMSGSKNGVQAIGSSISYGQRYAAKLLLNITSRNNADDDGQGALNNISSKKAKEDGLWEACCDEMGACQDLRELNKVTNGWKMKVPKSWLGSLQDQWSLEVERIRSAEFGLDRK